MRNQKITKGEIASYVILLGIIFSIMGWYSTRTGVPVEKPAQTLSQFSI
jgi:hypothetical protein